LCSERLPIPSPATSAQPTAKLEIKSGPGFVVTASFPDKLPASYSRHLVNRLRADFDLPGTPIRLTFSSQSEKNPFKGR